MDLMILSTVSHSMLNQASSFHCHVLKVSLVEYSKSIHLFGFLQRGRAKCKEFGIMEGMVGGRKDTESFFTWLG